MVIYCQKCKKDIAEVTLNMGMVRYHKENGILACRLRHDGKWGFQCMCGNDSRLAKAEKGIINSGPPTKEDLAKVEANLKAKPTVEIKTELGIICDGFIMKEA